MGTAHAAAAEKRRETTKQARWDVTDYALAGLRRAHYAGVFRTIEGAASPTFVAEIELDGFERSLEIRAIAQRDAAGQRYLDGMLSGLPLLCETRRFKLTRNAGRVDRYSGTIELHGASLVINILPTTAVNGCRVNLCHLEVLRMTAETRCRR